MSPRKVIAVDIDDTLADHVEAFISWSNQEYGTAFTVDSYSDHWSELWNTEHAETERRAIAFHEAGEHGRFMIKPGSKEVLVYLKERYDLVVVTARRQMVVEESRGWIQAHYSGIFSDVRFVPIWESNNTVTKAEICRELGASYLIDDLMRHCRLAAQAGIESLLFGDYSWNRHEELPDGVYRVQNWQHVKEFFDAKDRK